MYPEDNGDDFRAEIAFFFPVRICGVYEFKMGGMCCQLFKDFS